MSLVSTHEVSLWQPHISNCPLGDMAPVQTGVVYFLLCTDCILLAYPATFVDTGGGAGGSVFRHQLQTDLVD